MMEVADETTYVRHHKQKIAYILSAMRHHAEALREAGWTVDYVALDDPDNSGSFTGEVARAVERHDPERIVVTEARRMARAWRCSTAGRRCSASPSRSAPTTASSPAMPSSTPGRTSASTLTMEFFYREMRRKTGLLMDGGKPAGGRWNFDKENRKPAKADLLMPRPLAFAPDAITREVLALVAERFADHPGEPRRLRLRRDRGGCASGRRRISSTTRCRSSATTRTRC